MIDAVERRAPRAPTRVSCLGLACSALAACGWPAAERHPAPPRPSAPSASPAPPPAPAARVEPFHFYPQHGTGTVIRPALDSGSSLVLHEAVRWLLAPNGRDAEASPYVAPESLGTAVRAGTTWHFVGRSGTIYEADEPLGPLRAQPAPPEALRGLGFARGTPLGLTRAGQLLALDATRGWGPAAPLGAPPIDAFAVTDLGAILALAFPEALAVSSDRGASFAPLAGVEPMGVHSVTPRAGAVVIEAWGGKSWSWQGAGLVTDVPPAPPVAGTLILSVGGRPSAQQVARGRAVLDGTHYAEMREIIAADGTPGFRLMRAPLGERLVIAPTDLRVSCPIVAYAARGSEHALLCVGDDPTAHLFRSHDGAQHWTDDGILSECARPELALAPSGAAIVTGCCLSARPRCGLAPDVIALPSAGAGAAGVRALELPAELGDCAGPAWSYDGSRAFALCTTADGARAVVRATAAELRFESWLTPVPSAPPVSAAAKDARIGLYPGAEGELGVSVSVTDAVSYALVAPSGAHGEQLFPGGTKLGAFGRHLVVVDAKPIEEGRAGRTRELTRVRESFDGGITLHPMALPFPIDRSLEIACGEAGCAFGDIGARAGWPKSAADGGGDAPPLSPQPAPPPERPSGPKLACRYTTAPWHDLGSDGAGRWGALDQIGFGAIAWAWVRSDPLRDSAIDVTYARYDADPGQATTYRVFESVNRASVALHFAALGRGYLGARLWAPNGRFPDDGAASGRLELVWIDASDATTGRASLGQAGPFALSLREAAPHLDFDALGLGDGGVWLRPRPGDETLFVHRDGSLGPGLHFEGTSAIAGRPGRALQAIEQLFATDGGVLQGARYEMGALLTTRAGMTPALRQVAPVAGYAWRDALGWAVNAPRPAFAVAISDDGPIPRRAYGVALGPDGSFAPLPFALPSELGPAPRACTPDERKSAPRMRLKTAPASRAEVRLPAGEFDVPIALDEAAVCGTCAAAWKGGYAPGFQVVLTGDRTRGWVFRRRADQHSEWRPLECAPEG